MNIRSCQMINMDFVNVAPVKLITLNDLAKGLNSKQQIDAVLLDFSKAFYRVPHQRLLLKLQFYCICGEVVQCIRAFLTDRTLRVLIERQSSNTLLRSMCSPWSLIWHWQARSSSARFVTRDYCTPSSVTNMLCQLDWPALEHRRNVLKLVMLSKIHHRTPHEFTDSSPDLPVFLVARATFTYSF